MPGAAPYDNYNGGTAIRLFDPCTDELCEYTTSQQANMQSERWYPTVETLQDGSLIIVGSLSIKHRGKLKVFLGSPFLTLISDWRYERWWIRQHGCVVNSITINHLTRAKILIRSCHIAEYADNPTIEYFPSKGSQVGLNILAETLPCNLWVACLA